MCRRRSAAEVLVEARQVRGMGLMREEGVRVIRYSGVMCR